MSKVKNNSDEDHFGGHNDPEEAVAPRTWDWHLDSQSPERMDSDDCFISLTGDPGMKMQAVCEGHLIGFYYMMDSAVEAVVKWQHVAGYSQNIWWISANGNRFAVIIEPKEN